MFYVSWLPSACRRISAMDGPCVAYGGERGLLEWLRGNQPDYTSPVGGQMLPDRYMDGDDSGEGFASAAYMMSAYGTAWRRQKEEAGAECCSHFQAMRQRVSLVVCSES
eukprot:s2173_g5.t1